MQQVADWLEKLGLGQYAQRFAENDIDFPLFTKLTDADLKELGITPTNSAERRYGRECVTGQGKSFPAPRIAPGRAGDRLYLGVMKDT